jgi:hypothetical protein
MSVNHTFSKPVELHEDKLFSVDRRHNALDFNALANNHVRQVDDEPLTNWEMVAQGTAVSVLSGVPGVPSVMLHGAYVRSAVRGGGRGRDRR